MMVVVNATVWKKRSLWILPVFGILLAGVLPAFFHEMASVRLSECIGSRGEIEALRTDRTEQAGLADGLFFDGQQLIRDEETGIWYYSLTQGSAKAYDPVVRVSSGDGKVRLLMTGGIPDQEEIRENESRELFFYDNAHYETASLICTTLPLMRITCEGEISPDREVVSDVHVTLYDNRSGAADRLLQSDATLHVRGRTTVHYPKHSYRISLKRRSASGDREVNNDLSLLGMRSDDDWILYSAYNDHEKVRNVFCSNLWSVSCGTDNRDGRDTGTEYRYVELFLNGRYDGLYALGYPVQSKAFRYGKDSDRECLYKVNDFGDDNRLYFDREGTIVGYEPDREPAKGDPRGLLKKYYTTLGLYGDDNEVLRKGIDVDNAIDFWLFVDLIQGIDNRIKNYYLGLTEENGTVRALYAPWDMDASWGRSIDMSTYEYPADMDVIFRSGYLYRLIANGDPAIRRAVTEKYASLRKGAWSDAAIMGMLDGLETDIYGSGAFLRDRARWPDGNYWDPDKGLSDLRTFVAARLAYMDARMTDPDWEAYTDVYPASFGVYEEERMLSTLRHEGVKPLILMEILNPAVWEEDYYRPFYDEMGIEEGVRMDVPETLRGFLRECGLREEITADTRAVLWVPGEGNACSVQTGASVDTSMGTLACFEGEEGAYGIYLNGSEFYTGSRAQDEGIDIRIIWQFPEDESPYVASEWTFR